MLIRVHWTRQGRVTWEDWWLEQQGPTRSHLPDEEEHAGFANYDLEILGLRKLVRCEEPLTGWWATLSALDLVDVGRLEDEAVLSPQWALRRVAAKEIGRVHIAVGSHGFAFGSDPSLDLAPGPQHVLDPRERASILDFVHRTTAIYDGLR